MPPPVALVKLVAPKGSPISDEGMYRKPLRHLTHVSCALSGWTAIVAASESSVHEMRRSAAGQECCCISHLGGNRGAPGGKWSPPAPHDAGQWSRRTDLSQYPLGQSPPGTGGGLVPRDDLEA